MPRESQFTGRSEIVKAVTVKLENTEEGQKLQHSQEEGRDSAYSSLARQGIMVLSKELWK